MKRRGGEARTVSPLWLGVALVLATLIVYWPATDNGFVNYDDDVYVTDNAQVRQGLTRESLRWVWTAQVSANWHPLTLLSHMADVSGFGLDAAAHHRTSVLLHGLNALLLFVVLARMTGSRWQPAVVAALFALHPLHVESVAWIAERKNVLSTLFWILTMGAYARWVRSPDPRRYLLALSLFALGLMTKPMLVTLPFVLLLIDHWPLDRLRGAVGRRIVEKLPFFSLTVASSAITFVVQQRGGAVDVAGALPLAARVANAVVSYGRYLLDTLWPLDLAVLYPLTPAISPWHVVLSGAVVVTITVGAIASASTRPWFTVGWLWYLGTLVPVLGLVQVGFQSRADRYTYVPLIGIFVVLAWAGAEWLERRPGDRRLAAAVMLALLLVSSGVTRAQLRHWSDSVALWQRTIAVTEHNAIAHYNLGRAVDDRRDLGRAVEHYRQAIRLDPVFVEAHANLASAIRRQGDLAGAIPHYRRALELDPQRATSHLSLANAVAATGRAADAIEHYREAVRLDPDLALAHFNLANTLRQVRRYDEAIESYREAVRADPDFVEAQRNLELLLQRTGR